MNPRQQDLLKLVINRYIATAEPVGSQALVDSGDIVVSPATVRNELRELEELGYLTHPHTSAGRIPTEAGYRYYVRELMQPLSAEENLNINLRRASAEAKQSEKLKCLGKAAAAYVQNAVLVARTKDSFYYAGVAYLFSQPEFQDSHVTISVSSVFDQAEEYMDELYDRAGAGEQILVGSEQPFGESFSMLVSRVGPDSLFVILGPLRMDYARSQTVLQKIQELYL